MTPLTTVKQLLKLKSKVNINLGSSDAPMVGFINVDREDLPGVDIVCDLEKFPWPFPDASVDLIVASQLVEHINPHAGDSRIAPLIELLLKKKLVTPKEIKYYIGEIDPGPRFLRFMDECWRILKPKGQFMLATPYAGSIGFHQDPTHCNPCNELTFAYFDPLDATTGGELYKNYHPKPWHILENSWYSNGNLEVLLEKRPDVAEYHKSTIQGVNTKSDVKWY